MTRAGADSTESRERLVVPAPGQAWLVVHARPRAEKKLVQYCGQQGMATYLPLRTKVHRYGNRERAFSSPLFPGYVFCVATPAQRSLVMQNRHAAHVLDVFDQARLVEQLRQIDQALATGDVLEVMPYLESGRRVRVLAGPLKGLEGLVLRSKSNTRIVINVDMIRQAVAMEVDSAWLGPA
jgi:transcription antitermination factor NusG